MNAAQDTRHEGGWGHRLPDRPLTFDDLYALPDEDGHRYELQDGALIVSPAPSMRHQRMVYRLCAALEGLLPEQWCAVPMPGFAPREGQYREPDLVVCSATAAARMGTDYARADEILMAVEVVSPTTVATDRVLKPLEYAGHGIPYYLRVELSTTGRVAKLYLGENAANPLRRSDVDPERLYQPCGETMTGGRVLALPAPFTGALDPNVL